jgi:alkylresorcinol/alkylpyrone synthase
LVSIETAVPKHRITQDEARAFARDRFAGRDDVERLAGMFGRTAIDSRYLVRPLSWFQTPRSFEEKNAVYVEAALSLSLEAAEAALRSAEGDGVRRDEIAAVVFVTTTGIATPSLDSELVQSLGLQRHVTRIPVFGLGCAGGGAGLERARIICLGLGAPVLLICVEICSTTFVADDTRKSNVVATALFADGAAAAVIAPPGPGLDGQATLLGGVSHLVDDSADVMGWDVTDGGLRVRFSPRIPEIVHEHAPALMAAATRAAGQPIQDLVAHPGGRRVLEAYESALDLDREALSASWATLAAFGNMSGPTVLFALREHLEIRAKQRRQLEQSPRIGLALGLGPGFCAEGVVFAC